jgi:hypothetical protein
VFQAFHLAVDVEIAKSRRYDILGSLRAFFPMRTEPVLCGGNQDSVDLDGG